MFDYVLKNFKIFTQCLSQYFSENFGTVTANPPALILPPALSTPQPSEKFSNPPAVAIFGKCLPPS